MDDFSSMLHGITQGMDACGYSAANQTVCKKAWDQITPHVQYGLANTTAGDWYNVEISFRYLWDAFLKQRDDVVIKCDMLRKLIAPSLYFSEDLQSIIKYIDNEDRESSMIFFKREADIDLPNLRKYLMRSNPSDMCQEDYQILVDISNEGFKDAEKRDWVAAIQDAS